MNLGAGTMRMGIVFFMQDAFSNTAAKVQMRIESLTSSLGMLQTAGSYAFSAFRSGLGMLFGVGLLLYPFIQSIKKAQEFDMFERTYSTLLGSVSKGKELVAYMRDFALVTPFQTQDYIKGNLKMAQHGRGIDEIKEYTKLLSNMAVISQSSGGTYDRLAAVIGKIMGNAGIVTGTHMRQMYLYGFAPRSHEASKIVGWNVGQEYSKSGKHRMMTLDELKHIMEYYQNKYSVNGLTITEQIGKTAWGKFTNISEYLTKIQVAIGNALMPAYIPALDNLIMVMDTIYEILNSDFGKGLVIGLSNLFINAGLATAAFTAFWGISSLVIFTITTLRTVVTGMSVVFWGLPMLIQSIFGTYIVGATSATTATNGLTFASRVFGSTIAAVKALTFWEITLAVLAVTAALILVKHHLDNVLGGNGFEKIKLLGKAFSEIWSTADTSTMNFNISSALNSSLESNGLMGAVEMVQGVIFGILLFWENLKYGFTETMGGVFMITDFISSLGFGNGLSATTLFGMLKAVGFTLGLLIAGALGAIMIVIQTVYTIFTMLKDTFMGIINWVSNSLGFGNWDYHKNIVNDDSSEFSKVINAVNSNPSAFDNSYLNRPTIEDRFGNRNVLTGNPTTNVFNSIHLDGQELGKKVHTVVSQEEKERRYREQN
jgi:hypothetical protein